MHWQPTTIPSGSMEEIQEREVSPAEREEGYYKGPRNQQHLKFHSEAAPAGSDRWGMECAARAMPLIAPEFYNRTP